MKIRDQLSFIYRGAMVNRFHTYPTLKGQTVGAHSFGVAMWVWLLCEGEPTSTMILAALTHDLAEQVTGDIPSPAKRNLGIRDQMNNVEAHELDAHGLFFSPLLSEEHKRVLKLADAFDGAMHCIYERSLGNMHLDGCYRTYQTYIQELVSNGMEQSLAGEVRKMWHEATLGKNPFDS